MTQNNPRKNFLIYEFWLLVTIPAFYLIYISSALFAFVYYFIPLGTFLAIFLPFILSQFYLITNILQLITFKETNFGLRYFIFAIHGLLVMLYTFTFFKVIILNIDLTMPLVILYITYLLFTVMDILFIKKPNS